MSNIDEAMDVNTNNADVLVETMDQHDADLPDKMLVDSEAGNTADTFLPTVTSDRSMEESPVTERPAAYISDSEYSDMEQSDIIEEPELLELPVASPEPMNMEHLVVPSPTNEANSGMADTMVLADQEHLIAASPEPTDSNAESQERMDALLMEQQAAHGASTETTRDGAGNMGTTQPGNEPLPDMDCVTPSSPSDGVSARVQGQQDDQPKYGLEADAIIKAQVGRSGGTVPGAVAVQPTQPTAHPTPAWSQADEDVAVPGAFAVEPTQPTSHPTPAWSQADEDVASKARVGRNGDTMPGAVTVEPTQTTVHPKPAQSQAEEDAAAKARGARPSRRQHHAASVQAQEDADAKARARRSVDVTPVIVPGATRVVPSGGATESEDAVGGASMFTDDELTPEFRKMETYYTESPVGSPTDGGINSVSREGTPVFSNLTEDERQRRYDSKMMQMNQQHQDNRATNEPKGTGDVPVFSHMSEQERERRYDTKMAQLDQQHVDSKEKRGTSSPTPDEPYSERRLEPTSLRSSFNAEKPDHFDSVEPTAVTSGITTTADRGVAVAPDVEYGEYTQPRVNDNDLVVAIAIDEEEEEEAGKFFAYAVEYDPNSKPPLYRNRRFRLYGIIGVVGFIVLAIVLIVAVVVTKNDEDGSISSPLPAVTLSPTTARENMYMSFFAQAVSEKVYEPGTPHYSAANWIMNDDPMQLEPTDENLLQRYMLAFLYFHTTENGLTEWRSCNPPEEDEDDTCVFMEFTRLDDDKEFYEPRNGRIRWLSGQEECEWVGVECAGGDAVLGFRLMGQNLTGTLPTELAALPLLQRISMPYNQITGTLPAEYADLRHLLDLEVHGNSLTGTIPVEYFEKETMTLMNLNIGDNLLSGALDTRIGLMSDLKGLHIFENNFQGSFPSELGNLRFLTFCRVNGNEFTGPLPTELGRLGQLSEFWFFQNKFSGRIPSELGELYRLQDFRIWGNQLSGTIPDELFNMTKLWYFTVREMQLTGTLSPLVSKLTDLVALEVSTNKLTGTIPTEIQSLSLLQLVWLHYNLFTGQVPDAICSLVRPGGLEFLQADCFPVENPPNACLCCSACCDRDQQVCLTNDLSRM